MASLNKKHPYHSFIYYVLAGTAVVMFWRGAWGLMDLYLFPNSPVLSFIASIIISLFILIISHALKKL